ncbi:MAG: DUF6311 domain-containing protein, partial [Myxococcaceae bacterium]
MRVLSKFAAPLVAAIAGGVWFLLRGGWAVLNPYRVTWMLAGDWAMNLFGWLYYEPCWSLPLGRAPGLLHPVGSSLAAADAIPLMGVLVGPTLSGDAPTQYFGLWLLLCYALQGFFGALLTSTLTDDKRLQALGGVFFAVSPVLAHRIGHLALCGQWLLIAAIWLALRQGEEPKKTWAGLSVLCALAGAVHPYLALMTLALACAGVWGWRISRLHRAWAAFALLLPTVASLSLFGFLSVPRVHAVGFDNYTANLLSLVNPLGMSRVLPSFPVGAGQYEGFAYLGTGALALLVAGAALSWRARPALRAQVVPLIVVAGGLAVFALGSSVMLAGWKVASARTFAQHASLITEALRSPGRFIWPLHYLILMGVLALWFRSSRLARWAPAVIGVALVVQAADLSPGPTFGSL